MREQSISEAIGNVSTPAQEVFARVAEAILDRGAALLREADAIVTGPVPDGRKPLDGRISDQVGALIAGILAEAAATLIKGVQVASVYEYGMKNGRITPANAIEHPTVQHLRDRSLAIASSLAPETLKVQHAVAHELQEHGAIGLECRNNGPDGAGMPEGIADLLHRLQGGGPRGERAETGRKRRPIGFPRVPDLNDDDLPEC
jgi:hypothetical protein